MSASDGQMDLPWKELQEESLQIADENARKIYTGADCKQQEPEKYKRIMELLGANVSGRAIALAVRQEFPTGCSRNLVAAVLRDAIASGGLDKAKASAMVDAALVSKMAKDRVVDLIPYTGPNHLMALNAIAGTMHDKAFGADINLNITIGTRDSETSRRSRMTMDEIIAAMPKAEVISAGAVDEVDRVDLVDKKEDSK